MYYHQDCLWYSWCHSNTSLGNPQPDTNAVNRKKRSTTWYTWMAPNFLPKMKKTLMQTVKIYSQDIGMECDIEKCAMLVMKSGKWHMTEGVELPNQVVIRTLREKDTYKYLGILEADTIKQVKVKEKTKKRISQKNRKISRGKTL